MTPEKSDTPGMDLLRRNLDFAYETAATLAARERAQLDEYTSKIRFGSVSLNGASLLAAATIGPELPNLGAMDALVCAAFFLIGTVAGGVSLVSHQTQLVRTATKAEQWRIHTGRARSLVGSPRDSNAYDRFEVALAEAERIAEEGIVEAGVPAIISQALSLWAWVGGSVAVALYAFSEPVINLLN